MNVVTFTRLYPNRAQPEHGVFVEERMRRVAALPGHSLRVVAPVPFVPPVPVPRRYRVYRAVPPVERRYGIAVAHPRYPLLPKAGGAMHAAGLSWGSFPSVRRYHAARRIDVIDAHFLHPDGAAAMAFGRRIGLPVVLSARGSDALVAPARGTTRRMVEACVARATMLIAVSRRVAAALEALGGAAARIAVIANGVDGRLFSPRPAERERIRAVAGCRPGEALVLSVGRLEPVKGHDLLLDAFARIARTGLRARLAIVGEGSRAPALAGLAAERGIAGRVSFVGRIAHASLPAWYSAADLFCLPSRSEGDPNALLEALSCGLPSVATDVGSVSELVGGGDGRVVPPEDAEGLATGLAEALAARDRFDRARIRARAASRSWESVASRVDEVFREAMGRFAAEGTTSP